MGEAAPQQHDMETIQEPETPTYEAIVGQGTEHLSVETSYGQIEVTSDIGGPESKYKENQDSAFVVATQKSLSIGVIDGIGGGNGHRATIEANKTFREMLLKGNSIKDSTYEVDTVLRHLDDRCAVTFAGAEIRHLKGREYEIDLAAIGDARIITVRRGQAVPGGATEFQNTAHTLLKGSPFESEVYNHPLLNQTNGALGAEHVENTSLPQFIRCKGYSGDVIVAASDGVWDSVSEFEITEICKKFNVDAVNIEKAIFDLAIERNNRKDQFTIRHNLTTMVRKTSHKKGADNVTVAVISLT